MAKEESKPQIAYVPYNTFNNAIEAMEHTLPPQLDKTMWKSYSGAIQSQLWSAFKFFNLVSADGTPTKALVELVKDKTNRKAHIRKLLETYYPKLMALDLAKVTSGHFNKTMEEYGLGSETQNKARTFFLQAAKAAGIPLSSFLLKNTRASGGRKARRNGAAKQKDGGPAPVVPLAVNPFPANGPVKTIALENGIALSLSTSADTFRMTPADRKFVNSLLEQLETYEAEHQPEPEELQEDEEIVEDITAEEPEEVQA